MQLFGEHHWGTSFASFWSVIDALLHLQCSVVWCSVVSSMVQCSVVLFIAWISPVALSYSCSVVWQCILRTTLYHTLQPHYTILHTTILPRVLVNSMRETVLHYTIHYSYSTLYYTLHYPTHYTILYTTHLGLYTTASFLAFSVLLFEAVHIGE